MLATGASYESRGMIGAGIPGYHPGFPTMTQFPGYPPAAGQECSPSTAWNPAVTMPGSWGQMTSHAITKDTSPTMPSLLAPNGNHELAPPVSPPPQKERFSYTRYQLELLNGIFDDVKYPNSVQKQLIAKRVGITRDQVKIWFQNRRRKDVVASKRPEQAQAKMERKMVPDSVMTSVLTELGQYIGEKGKFKTKTKRSRKNARKEPYPTGGSTSPESECFSFKDESNSPGDYMPNGDLSSLTSPETRCSSVSSSTPSMPTIPSAADMNMVAPPNVVAPPSTVTLSGLFPVAYNPVNISSCSKESDGLSSPKQPESGYFDISPHAAPQMSPPSLHDNTPESNPISPISTSSDNKDNFIPPNKIAPPSEPINYDAVCRRPLPEPLRVVIPQSQMPKVTTQDYSQHYQTHKYSQPTTHTGDHYERDNVYVSEDKFMRYTAMGLPPVPGLRTTPPTGNQQTYQCTDKTTQSIPTTQSITLSQPKMDKCITYPSSIDQSYGYPAYPGYESYPDVSQYHPVSMQMPSNAYYGQANGLTYNPAHYAMDKPRPLPQL